METQVVGDGDGVRVIVGGGDGRVVKLVSARRGISRVKAEDRRRDSSSSEGVEAAAT